MPSPSAPAGRATRASGARNGLPVGNTHCLVALYERSGAPAGSFLVKRQPAFSETRVRGLSASAPPVPPVPPVVVPPPVAVLTPPLPVAPLEFDPPLPPPVVDTLPAVEAPVVPEPVT